MARYWVGCAGWSYADWVGPFYPPGTPPGEFLSRYARVFSLTEVDSSWYHAPSRFLTHRWASATPTGFRFALKVPQEITHGGAPEPLATLVERFLAGIDPLRRAGKLAPLVAQFPASFRRDAGLPRLEEILSLVPPDVRLAVELRHRSWWVPEVRQLLESRRAALVWSVIPHTRPPAWVTTDLVYARFIGDRALTTFDRIQRDGRPAMEEMRARFRDEGRSALEIYALVNNHFMGFGPGSAQVLEEVLGLRRSDLTRAARPPGQTALGV